MNTLELAILALSITVGQPQSGLMVNMNTPGTEVQEKTVHLTAGYGSMMKDYSESCKEEFEWLVGYCTASHLNIRYLPTTDSESIGKYTFNEKITYIEYDKDWNLVSIDGNDVGYVAASYVDDEKSDGRVYDVPVAHHKTYMPYTAITSRGSDQYKLQQIAYTGDYGIRMYDGRYLIAIGTAFNAKVGTYFDLVLANGTKIEAIVGDIKSRSHTRDGIVTSASDCLSEYIVDYSSLNSNARRMGDMSYCCDDWNSIVKQVIVYDKVVSL